MPCGYEISVERRLVSVRGWGELTHAEATETRLRFANDPSFNRDFFQIYDLSEVTRLAMTGDEIRELATHAPFSPHARRAAVAPLDAIYGALRMFATQHEAILGNDNIGVFRSSEEAEKWLGLKESPAAHNI